MAAASSRTQRRSVASHLEGVIALPALKFILFPRRSVVTEALASSLLQQHACLKIIPKPRHAWRFLESWRHRRSLAHSARGREELGLLRLELPQVLTRVPLVRFVHNSHILRLRGVQG
eukprot:CAMPEP_0194546108 /NCGR_PEP_ID=MMETSP0253-20130528/90168_2 /TAXON_ID=2966 /ORGANISM="Noctiluca scintillans" /LENGTH=117 /DNA_ID=CAMNT_0039393167 /DNA_START=165 /DNA_END=514 /DNA_ORIENTATION=-